MKSIAKYAAALLALGAMVACGGNGRSGNSGDNGETARIVAPRPIETHILGMELCAKTTETAAKEAICYELGQNVPCFLFGYGKGKVMTANPGPIISYFGEEWDVLEVYFTDDSRIFQIDFIKNMTNHEDYLAFRNRLEKTVSDIYGPGNWFVEGNPFWTDNTNSLGIQYTATELTYACEIYFTSRALREDYIGAEPTYLGTADGFIPSLLPDLQKGTSAIMKSQEGGELLIDVEKVSLHKMKDGLTNVSITFRIKNNTKKDVLLQECNIKMTDLDNIEYEESGAWNEEWGGTRVTWLDMEKVEAGYGRLVETGYNLKPGTYLLHINRSPIAKVTIAGEEAKAASTQPETWEDLMEQMPKNKEVLGVFEAIRGKWYVVLYKRNGAYWFHDIYMDTNKLGDPQKLVKVSSDTYRMAEDTGETFVAKDEAMYGYFEGDPASTWRRVM